MNEINIIDASLSEIVEGGESRRKELRDKIVTLEKAILDIPGTTYGDQFPLKHSFGDGLYAREIQTPAGQIIVTKIHRFAHPFFLLKGKAIIVTEEGEKTIEAPYWGITPAGTKRALYIVEDVIWVTVHRVNIKENGTTEQDLKSIEKDIIELEKDNPLFEVIEGEKIDLLG